MITYWAKQSHPCHTATVLQFLLYVKRFTWFSTGHVCHLPVAKPTASRLLRQKSSVKKYLKTATADSGRQKWQTTDSCRRCLLSLCLLSVETLQHQWHWPDQQTHTHYTHVHRCTATQQVHRCTGVQATQQVHRYYTGDGNSEMPQRTEQPLHVDELSDHWHG